MKRALFLLGSLVFLTLLLGNDPVSPVRGSYSRYAVAADHPLASEAGAELLAAGGNAADAAAATMLALGVVNPQSSGLGGGGFGLYYDAESGEITYLDFRETAPAASTADMYADQQRGEGPAANRSQLGGLASGVPGEPAGIAQLASRFGTKTTAEIAAPAIRLADDGFQIGEALARMSIPFGPQMRSDRTMRRWFAGAEGGLNVGDTLQRPELARSLRDFASSGAESFYRGRIARAIVTANRRNGGIMTAQDLSGYQVVEREAVSGERFGFTWHSSPAPSAGGYTMLSSLALLEAWIPPAERRNAGSPLMHAFAESWKGPFWDRASYFGDPDHVNVPVQDLMHEARTRQRINIFRPQLAVHADEYALPLPNHQAGPASPPEEHGTSHLCVVDEHGNVAAVTTTVNLPFGARYTAAGIVLNDEMDDFASAVGEANAFGLPGGAPNLPGPGRRPVSSMSPTIVVGPSGAVLCIGGSGGSRIITAAEQVAYHILVRGLDPAAAIAEPRVHHQGYPNTLRTEETNPHSDAVLAELRARGHVLETAHHSAIVQTIQITANGLIAASDPRKGGEPRGQ